MIREFLFIKFHFFSCLLRAGFSFSANSLERFCFNSFHFVFCLFSVTLIIPSPSLLFPNSSFFLLLFFLRHRADFSFYSRNLLPKIRPNGKKRGWGGHENFFYLAQMLFNLSVFLSIDFSQRLSQKVNSFTLHLNRTGKEQSL